MKTFKFADGCMIEALDGDWVRVEVAEQLQLIVEHRDSRIVQLRDGRRERIATANMQGILSGAGGNEWSADNLSKWSIKYADALIERLDDE